MLQSSTHFRCSPLDLHQFANLSCTKCMRIGDNTLLVKLRPIRVGKTTSTQALSAAAQYVVGFLLADIFNLSQSHPTPWSFSAKAPFSTVLSLLFHPCHVSHLSSKNFRGFVTSFFQLEKLFLNSISSLQSTNCSTLPKCLTFGNFSVLT